jgi:hypothetical protein
VPVHTAGSRIACGEERKDEWSDMWKWIKNILLFLVVAFFLFFIIAQPEQAGEFFQNVFEGIAVVFESLMKMFTSMTNG